MLKVLCQSSNKTLHDQSQLCLEKPHQKLLKHALEVFDAVSRGTVEIGHGASYYWIGKAPSAQFFTALPFGLNAQEMNAWLHYGGGLELWEEAYNQYNLIPLACQRNQIVLIISFLPKF